MFWTYVLQNPKGRFYVGHTENPAKRLADHNFNADTQGKWTRKNGPWKRVWCEPHPTRSSAMRRERQIKSMKSARWIRTQLTGGPENRKSETTGQTGGLNDWTSEGG